MRDYNFRKNNKIKETKRRKHIYYDVGYLPSSPKEQTNEDGELYYVEGVQSKRKQGLKRIANKRVRKSKYGSIVDGGHYKKIYDLPWIWY